MQNSPACYRIVNVDALKELPGIKTISELQQLHRQRVDEALRTGRNAREGVWSESLTVGGGTFVEAVKAELKGSGRYRRIHSSDHDIHGLKEPVAVYQVDFDTNYNGVGPS